MMRISSIALLAVFSLVIIGCAIEEKNPVRERVKFSDKLLKWYPDIYKDLGAGNAQDKLAVLRKITEADENRKPKHKEEVTDGDIAGVIGELLSDGGKGLRHYQKRAICYISYGNYYGADGFDENGEYYRIDMVWHSKVISTMPYIRRLLKDGEAMVRWDAVQALSGMNARDTIPDIKELLKDENSQVREVAVEALDRMNVKDAIWSIKPLLNDKNEWVRRSTVRALGNLNAKESILDIKELLKDVNESVRGYAAEALVKLEGKDAIPDIKEFLKNEDDWVREMAIKALRQLGVSEEEIEKAKNSK